MHNSLPSYPSQYVEKSRLVIDSVTSHDPFVNPYVSRKHMGYSDCYYMGSVEMGQSMPPEITHFLADFNETDVQTSFPGDLQVRRAIYNYYARRYDNLYKGKFSPDSVLMLQDATDGLNLAFLSCAVNAIITRRLEKTYVAVPQMRWQGIDLNLENHPFIGILEIPQLPDGMWDMEFMQRYIAGRKDIAAVYRASPGSPDGYIASAEETQKLAAFLKEHKIPYIEDVALERYTGVVKSPIPLLAQYSNTGVTVGNSAYMWRSRDAGLNVGWMFGADTVMQPMIQEAIRADFKPPKLLNQLAMIAATELPDSYYEQASLCSAGYNAKFKKALRQTPLVPIRSVNALSVTFDASALIGKTGISPIVSELSDAADISYDMAYVCGVMPSPVINSAQTHIRFAIGKSVAYESIGARVLTYCTLINDDRISEGLANLGGRIEGKPGIAFRQPPSKDDLDQAKDAFGMGGIMRLARRKQRVRDGI